MGADGESGTTIGRLHRQEEKIIEKSGIPYTFLRPTSFMQNFVNIYAYTIKSNNMHQYQRGFFLRSMMIVEEEDISAKHIILPARKHFLIIKQPKSYQAQPERKLVT